MQVNEFKELVNISKPQRKVLFLTKHKLDN